MSMNEYEEFKKSNELNDDDVIRLTPMGALAVILSKHFDLEMNTDNINKIRDILDEFESWCAERAAYDEWPVGYTALVFTENGGECCTVMPNNE